MECLSRDYSSLLRKVTLGCLPRKTVVQRTFVSPLASWNRYLHVTCIARPGLKLKNCGIALLYDAMPRSRAGDARHLNSVSRHLQNNSECVTPLTRPACLKDVTWESHMSKNSLTGTSRYWGRAQVGSVNTWWRNLMNSAGKMDSDTSPESSANMELFA